MRILLATVPLILLAGCGEKATLPVEAGIGENPTLPQPVKTLLPTMNIAEVNVWPEGAKPVAASGLAVKAFAAGLEHPRWLLVLPDGGVLVAETSNPPKPDDGKGVRGFVQGLLMKKENPSTPFQPVWSAPVQATAGVMIINKNAPHPYAAALWSDWVLSDESQKYTAEQYRGPVTIPHPYMPADAKIVISDSSDPAVSKRLLEMWDKYVTHGKD